MEPKDFTDFTVPYSSVTVPIIHMKHGLELLG